MANILDIIVLKNEGYKPITYTIYLSFNNPVVSTQVFHKIKLPEPFDLLKYKNTERNITSNLTPYNYITVIYISDKYIHPIKLLPLHDYINFYIENL